MFSSFKEEDLSKIAKAMTIEPKTKTKLVYCLDQTLFDQLESKKIIFVSVQAKGSTKAKFDFTTEARKEFEPLSKRFTIHIAEKKPSGAGRGKAAPAPSGPRLTPVDLAPKIEALTLSLSSLGSRMSLLESRVSSLENQGTSPSKTVTRPLSQEDFKSKLRQRFDSLNLDRRYGGLVPIPELWDAMSRSLGFVLSTLYWISS